MAEVDEYRIVIPSVAAHLATVRLFVATVMRTLGAGEESTADVKLAASELATAAMSVAGESGRVTVTIRRAPTGAELRVSPAPAVAPNHAAAAPSVDPMAVVDALFPGVRIDEDTSLVVVPVDQPGSP